MTDFLTVRRNDMLLLGWQIENWVPKTKLGLTVDPDPGSGRTPIPLAPDAHTGANGAGSFLQLEMPLLGIFTYTLTIKKPQGDEKRTIVVQVMDLHYRSFSAASGKTEVGGPLRLSWGIDAAEGCGFKLDATLPDATHTQTGVAVDKNGDGF